jgi:hypothetical protein
MAPLVARPRTVGAERRRRRCVLRECDGCRRTHLLDLEQQSEICACLHFRIEWRFCGYIETNETSVQKVSFGKGITIGTWVFSIALVCPWICLRVCTNVWVRKRYYGSMVYDKQKTRLCNLLLLFHLPCLSRLWGSLRRIFLFSFLFCFFLLQAIFFLLGRLFRIWRRMLGLRDSVLCDIMVMRKGVQSAG